MKPFLPSVFLLSIIVVPPCFGGKAIATITSAEPFALDGHSVNTPGVSSFPVVVGDTVATSRGPAVLLFADGSALKLGSNSSVRISGPESKPRIVLLAGALDYKLVPGSNLSVTNLDSEHKVTASVSAPAAIAPVLSAGLHLHPGQVAQQAPLPPPVNSNQNVSAVYTGEDINTLGNWKGKYGADGELIASDITNPPPYATVSIIGNGIATLSSDSNDPRALQSASGNTGRVVTTYANNFTIDVNLTDGNTHKISLYLADFDNSGRAETITVIDPATKTVLSTQNFASFANGVYETWTIKGHVQMRVVATGKGSAIVNGIFFDAAVAAAAPPDSTSGSTGASGAPNATHGILTSPKFLVPLAAAAAVGITAGVLADLPPLSRNQ